MLYNHNDPGPLPEERAFKEAAGTTLKTAAAQPSTASPDARAEYEQRQAEKARRRAEYEEAQREREARRAPGTPLPPPPAPHVEPKASPEPSRAAVIPRSVRANDPMATRRDRSDAQAHLMGRGLIDVDRVIASESNAWYILGFFFFILSMSSTIYGVIFLWSRNMNSTSDLSSRQFWSAFTVGLILGSLFVFGQVSFFPGLWRAFRGRGPFYPENLAVYLALVAPDVISTALCHWSWWVHHTLVFSYGDTRLVWWMSFALVAAIALFTSTVPLLAVIRRERGAVPA